MLELQDGTRTNVKQLTHSNKPAQNQQTSWLTQGCSTFGARKKHEWPRTHKTHRGPDSGEATFPHIVYYAPPHGNGNSNGILSRDFQMGVSKSLRLGVATPLWPSVGVKPNTSKVEDLESSRTPECLDFNSKAQNTSHWGVLGVIGKVLKRK
jgi:hypothetical protein